MENKKVDLRQEPASRVQTLAFYEVKGLRPGEAVTLLTAEEPSLVARSLDLQLQHKLAWTIVREQSGGWRTEIHHRADVAPVDLVDLLTRDHQRLDGLFARALQLVNRNELAEAAPLIGEFASGLRRHAEVENDLLAICLPLPRDPAGADPLSIMLREHEEILGQLALIESCYEGGVPEAGELAAFMAILSGTLAKHEYREENNLFPLWEALLGRESQEGREDLAARVRETLKGGEMKDKG